MHGFLFVQTKHTISIFKVCPLIASFIVFHLYYFHSFFSFVIVVFRLNIFTLFRHFDSAINLLHFAHLNFVPKIIWTHCFIYYLAVADVRRMTWYELAHIYFIMCVNFKFATNKSDLFNCPCNERMPSIGE